LAASLFGFWLGLPTGVIIFGIKETSGRQIVPFILEELAEAGLP
jgi:hypothetical protein